MVQKQSLHGCFIWGSNSKHEAWKDINIGMDDDFPPNKTWRNLCMSKDTKKWWQMSTVSSIMVGKHCMPSSIIHSSLNAMGSKCIDGWSDGMRIGCFKLTSRYLVSWLQKTTTNNNGGFRYVDRIKASSSSSNGMKRPTFVWRDWLISKGVADC